MHLFSLKKKSNKSTNSLYLNHLLKFFFIIIVIDRALCMIKNGDDTNVLGTIATFAPSDRQGWLRAWRKREREEEEKSFFPKYQVNKINQNYNNAVYKWVKSDEFLRGVTPSPQFFHTHREKIGLCPPLATNLCYAPG